MNVLFYIMIIALPAVVGCEKRQSFKDIDSDIVVKMRETLDTAKRSLQLDCHTEKIYPCYNYSISNSLRKSSKKITVEFNEIVVPYICLTAFGPARATIDLGTLSNGTYDISIFVNNNQSTGSLIVDPQYYKLDFDVKKQLDLEFTRLNRVPENTIWGRVNYHESSTEKLAETFIDSLRVIGAESQNYLPGEYGYFRIDSIGNILPPEHSGYKHVEPFIFKYEGKINDLKELVNNYRQLHGDLLIINVKTSEGETF